MTLSADELMALAQWLGRTSVQAGVLILLILAAQMMLRNLISPRWRHAL